MNETSRGFRGEHYFRFQIFFSGSESHRDRRMCKTVFRDPPLLYAPDIDDPSPRRCSVTSWTPPNEEELPTTHITPQSELHNMIAERRDHFVDDSDSKKKKDPKYLK